jgi:hypothetical protein
VLTSLSNAVIELNPFSGLQTIDGVDTETATLEALVALLGPGELMEWDAWPEHFALLSAAAVEALAGPDTSTANVLNRLKETGGRLLLSDCIFLHDPHTGLFDEEVLEPHERRRPMAWGLLRQRLYNWLRLGCDNETARWKSALNDFRRDQKPVTLHITHSWGGGVAKWVESFIEADGNTVNFQFRSEEVESGKGYGQRFSLYLGNQLEAPVATWWL